MSEEDILSITLWKRRFYEGIYKALEATAVIPVNMLVKLDADSLEKWTAEALAYVQAVEIYNKNNDKVMKNLLIRDLKPNLKHHSLHCLSFSLSHWINFGTAWKVDDGPSGRSCQTFSKMP